jgi:ketosteroid isomerase-like protein
MRTLTFRTTLFLLSGCGNNSVDTKAEGEKLMQLSREWSKLASTDSTEKILSYWADDAVMMSPGQPPIKGKEEIRQMVTSLSNIPGFKISWEPLSAHVAKSGDMAYLIEQNQISFNDSLGRTITEFNKVVTVWRRDADGAWKNVVDMWNAEPPRKQ